MSKTKSKSQKSKVSKRNKEVTKKLKNILKDFNEQSLGDGIEWVYRNREAEDMKLNVNSKSNIDRLSGDITMSIEIKISKPRIQNESTRDSKNS